VTKAEIALSGYQMVDKLRGEASYSRNVSAEIRGENPRTGIVYSDGVEDAYTVAADMLAKWIMDTTGFGENDMLTEEY